MPQRPVLIVGDDHVSQRVAEELRRLHVPLVLFCSAPDAPAAVAAAAAGDRVVCGRATDAALWAGFDAAEVAAIGVLGADDLANIDVALLVAERHPEARLVLRLFAAGLADGVGRMLGGRATVLSDVQEAAPTFLRAALSGNEGERVTLAGRVLEVAEVEADDPRLVAVLCNASTPTEVLPPRDRLEPLVLGLIDPQGSVRTARGVLPAHVAALRVKQDRARVARPPAHQRALALLRIVPRRAWVLATAILTVFALSTTVFAVSDHLDPIDAAYFTATTMATVGYGDVNLLGAPDWLKIYDLGLMAVSAVLLASVLAVLTDLLVSQRLDRALGRFPRPTHDHVIVCGLGKAGAAIVQGLHDLGIPCVGLERDGDAVGVALARSLEVPVRLGDARDPGLLDHVDVDRARAVLAVTTDDLANVQTGLLARSASADVRIVLRIFDPELATRLDRMVEFDLTRSVSGLAAPAFAAALLGRPSARSLAISNVPLRVLDVEVAAGSPLVGRTLAAVHAEGELRVLALADRWLPRTDAVVAAGDRVSVVGTPAATDALLRA